MPATPPPVPAVSAVPTAAVGGPPVTAPVGPRSGADLRRALVGLYGPALLYSVGTGAVVPILALHAVDLGADLALAGLVVALMGIGHMLGDLPAGALAARVGDRRAMLVAAGLSAVAFAGCALAPAVWVLAVATVAVGAVGAVFALARQAYLVEVTPVAGRARALATLAGLDRIGAFVGPFLGAGVVHLADLRAVFFLAVLTSLAAGVVVAAMPDAVGDAAHRRRTGAPAPLRTVARDHARVFTTLGLAILLVGIVRAGRQVGLPLWAEHLGLSAATTSVVFGISGAIDVLLFYPAGRVMDRRGRLWVAIPSMVVLGVATLALPWTTTLAGVTAVAAAMGVGNGISSGILMTLGADVAPAAVRAQFLGIWQLLAHAGSAAGPMVVSAGAAAGSLAGGLTAMGATGVLAAAALAQWVPRWSEHANARTRRAAAARRLAAQGELAAPPEAGPG